MGSQFPGQMGLLLQVEQPLVRGPLLGAPPKVKFLTPYIPVVRSQQWPSWLHRRLQLPSATR